jgi:hypothetical protein
MTMTLEYNTPSAKIASELVGKTVRYLASKSKSTPNGVRVFKIESVENVDFAAKTGKRFVTVFAKDIDDSGVAKYRNLHLAGIDLVV